MKNLFLCFIFGQMTFLPAIAQEKSTPEAEAFFTKAMAEINPKHAAWIKSTAKNITEKKLSETSAKSLVANYGASDKLNNLDIEALTFLVLMQASKDAQADMKEIMADIKKNNEKKKQLIILKQKLEKNKNNISRLGLDSVKMELKKQPDVKMVKIAKKEKEQKPVQRETIKNVDEKQFIKVKPTVSKPEIDEVAQEINVILDTVSENGEMSSLQLQMAMDRLNKMMNTLNNIMKKISDTSSDIIGNLK